MKSTRLSYYTLALTIGALLFASCNKEENAPQPDMASNYFPLKLNQVNIYQVDSTVYNDFNNSVTLFQFQLKDIVVGKFKDAEGIEAYRIERYKKTDTEDWFFQKLITRRILKSRAEEVLDNKRYVRLVFPPSLQSTWNGNLYNDLDVWRHEITAIDVPLTIGTNKLDSTLSITQHNENNLIREDIYLETYAKNIGLVLKEVKAYDKEISTGRIRRGFKYKMQLNSYTVN
ncbi:hypothetical protein [Pedobacter nanyangensis]|uniref:hypothetical protein n=1 Tax=Pedobacter nanyangensis TaxID=1562389 RepID=UPI000DE35E87|nr:hypothetical protein [Pedobacter nanyangensis]